MIVNVDASTRGVHGPNAAPGCIYTPSVIVGIFGHLFRIGQENRAVFHRRPSDPSHDCQHGFAMADFQCGISLQRFCASAVELLKDTLRRGYKGQNAKCKMRPTAASIKKLVLVAAARRLVCRL